MSETDPAEHPEWAAGQSDWIVFLIIVSPLSREQHIRLTQEIQEATSDWMHARRLEYWGGCRSMDSTSVGMQSEHLFGFASVRPGTVIPGDWPADLMPTLRAVALIRGANLAGHWRPLVEEDLAF